MKNPPIPVVQQPAAANHYDNITVALHMTTIDNGVVKKGAKTIEAETRQLSTDIIQYARKFVYASVRSDCKYVGDPRWTGIGARPNHCESNGNTHTVRY